MTKIEDSCGCVFCDIELEPVRHSQDGTLWHDTKRGSFLCEGPKNELAREKFKAAMARATTS